MSKKISLKNKISANDKTMVESKNISEVIKIQNQKTKQK